MKKELEYLFNKYNAAGVSTVTKVNQAKLRAALEEKKELSDHDQRLVKSAYAREMDDLKKIMEARQLLPLVRATVKQGKYDDDEDLTDVTMGQSQTMRNRFYSGANDDTYL